MREKLAALGLFLVFAAAILAMGRGNECDTSDDGGSRTYGVHANQLAPILEAITTQLPMGARVSSVSFTNECRVDVRTLDRPGMPMAQSGTWIVFAKKDGKWIILKSNAWMS